MNPFRIHFALIATTLVMGCSPSITPASERRALCSTLPVYCFTAAIAGDAMPVELLPEPHIGPHSYRLSLQDRERLQAAHVFVINGLDLETEIPSAFLEELRKGGTTIINAGETMPASSLIQSGMLDISPPDHKDGHEHDDDHMHGPHDPHIWLCRNGALAMATAIRDGFIQADEAHTGTYRTNAAILIDRINRAFDDAHEQLRPLQGTKLLTFHDAWAYFAREFGFNFIATLTSAGHGMNLHTREYVEKLIRTGAVTTIFVEPQFDASAAQSLAKDTGVAIAILDPMETRVKPLSRDLYFDVLAANVQELKRAPAPSK